MDLTRYNSDLKRIQVKYDDQITKLINNLDQQASKKQYDYKECEELSRHAGRLTNRWRKLASLSVETFIEYDSEIKLDKQKIQKLEFESQNLTTFTDTLNQENENLANLVEVMSQVIAKVEAERMSIGI
jgi:hypothetical protein